MTEKQGKLKYSENDKSWCILLKNNSIKKLKQNADIALLEVKSSSNIGYVNEEREVIVY